MKRKVYADRRERKADQVWGFIAFPVVNAALWLLITVFVRWIAAQYDLDNALLAYQIALWLPWLVNGVVLAWAFIFRPEIGVGYIAFIAVAIASVITLSMLFVAACFVSYLAVGWFFPPLICLLFPALFLLGFYYLFDWALKLYKAWESQ